MGGAGGEPAHEGSQAHPTPEMRRCMVAGAQFQREGQALVAGKTTNVKGRCEVPTWGSSMGMAKESTDECV